MKTLKICIATFCLLFFTGCEYPVDRIENISVSINAQGNNDSKQVTLNASCEANVESIITEYGFIYTTYQGNRGERYKQVVSRENFNWQFTLREDFLVATIRAYVIADGIFIYSDREIDVSGLVYL